MSYTKRQYIIQAFEEIGYADYQYDLQPEQLQSALRRLDAMIATWNGRNINIGYPLPTSPQNSDLDEESDVPDWASEAIYLNLAIRIAPTVGKTVSQETRMSARNAYNQMVQNVVLKEEMKFPRTLGRGAGNKPWRYDEPFINDQYDGIVTPPKNEVDFNG